jgi:glycosyltransferase involved in cell wall biosynthesis
MTADPRVVFGLPAYRRPDALNRALESLLAQTYRDVAIVIVDDAPSADVRAIVESYATHGVRLAYEPNAVRLGMVGNWRKAFERSRQLYPGSEYFAWASDHDVWHPRWLEVLVPVLDADPRIVLAYPHTLRMYPNDRRRVEGTFDTTGVTQRERRLCGTIATMTAGNAIYGLFRAAALRHAGVFRPVLLPDRQVLSQLSLLGEFRHVPGILWYREASRTFSYERQRKMLFAGRTPLHTYLPVDLQHVGILLWDLGVLGRGRPAFGRLPGLWYAAAFFWYSIRKGIAGWHAARRRLLDGRLPPSASPRGAAVASGFRT